MSCRKHVPCVHTEPLPSGALLVRCSACRLVGKIPIPSLSDQEYFRGRHHEGLEYTGSAKILWAEGGDPESLIRPACAFCGVPLPDDRILCDTCLNGLDRTLEELRWS